MTKLTSKPAFSPPRPSPVKPRNDTGTVISLVTPCSVKAPVTSNCWLPRETTLLLLKLISGMLATSKKSGERRWSSRCWLSVSMLAVLILNSTDDASGFARSTWMAPSKSPKRPRTLLTKCRTWKVASEWARSMLNVSVPAAAGAALAGAAGAWASPYAAGNAASTAAIVVVLNALLTQSSCYGCNSGRWNGQPTMANGYSTRPRAATAHSSTTSSPRTTTTRSCRLETTQAWFGSTRTFWPTRNESPSATSTTPCSSLRRDSRLAVPRTMPWPFACGRSGSLDSVLLPASRTARPAAGTLTTVASTVSAQSSGAQLPSATCDAS